MERSETTHTKGIERWDADSTEYANTPKPGRDFSEDRVLVDERVYAVLDGVSTGSSPERIEHQTLGRFAALIGTEALKDAARECARIEDVVPFVSRRLIEALRPYHGQYTESPSFVFVAFFPKWNTILRVGDAQYKIVGKSGLLEGENPGHAVDHDKEVVRQALLKKAEERGLSKEEAFQDSSIRRRMTRLTKEWQPQFRNNPAEGRRGYGVISGEPVHHIEYIPVPADARAVILASDGYYDEALRGDLTETNKEQERLEGERAAVHHPDDKTYLLIRAQ